MKSPPCPRRRLWFATALCVAACTPKPPLNLDRVRNTSSDHGGARPLVELDTDGNGKIDARDWKIFERIAAHAAALIAEKKLAVGVGHALYQGPNKEASSIFSLVATTGGKIDLSAVPSDRLEELAVETRWAGKQARIASFIGGSLNGKSFGGILAARFAGYSKDEMEPAAVCRAIESFDKSPYAKVGVDSSAVFDLDSTVWKGNVTDVFLALLAAKATPKPVANAPLQKFLKTVPGIDHKIIDNNSVAQNAALLLERATNRKLPREQRVSPKDSFYNTVALLAGLTRAEVRVVARAAYEEGTGPFPPWKDRVFADEDGCGMREIIAALQRNGVEVYLLSATLDVLANEGGRLFGVPEDHILGSLLAVEDGRYTGKVADSTYYTKGAIIRQWLPAPPAFVFGDSPTSDFSMLIEAWSAAFMVNPREKLQVRDDEEAGSRMVALWFDGTAGELSGKK